jgi:Domain of unknown function (DUF4189)
MADASTKRVGIVMRCWTAITVYALLSATPAFAAGGGAIAWDRDTGKYGASWNQSTPKQATEAAITQCGASGCKVVLKVCPMMCGALATSGDSKKAGAAMRKDLVPPVLPPSHLARRIREPPTARSKPLIVTSKLLNCVSDSPPSAGN